MATITVHLSDEDGGTFRALSRLAGKSEGSLAGDLLRDYVRVSLEDPDFVAALRAIEKLSDLSKGPRGDARKVAPIQHDSSPAGSSPWQDRNSQTRARRTVHNRSVANLADGIEVSFRGVRARIAGGKMHIDGARPFDSPSAAAVHVAGGGSFNGWREWKDDDGTELRALHDG